MKVLFFIFNIEDYEKFFSGITPNATDKIQNCHFDISRYLNYLLLLRALQFLKHPKDLKDNVTEKVPLLIHNPD